MRESYLILTFIILITQNLKGAQKCSNTLQLFTSIFQSSSAELEFVIPWDRISERLYSEEVWNLRERGKKEGGKEWGMCDGYEDMRSESERVESEQN